ncbi:MAG: hypothetical protein PUC23_03500 [bacterium]|nr:hypothetical protein [bacterium]
MKKELFKFLYAVSLGAWMTSMFIATYYDNVLPMWILLVVMNGFNILKEIYNT